ncbi:hypothetical protein ACLB1Q_00790 [Escherichia coli]
MSVHICSNCGHHEPIFGTGGAEKLAEKIPYTAAGADAVTHLLT